MTNYYSHILKLIVIILLVNAHDNLYAQSKGDYEQRIKILDHNIYKYFYDTANGLYYETNAVAVKEKPHSYLWPLCALIQAANEEEKMQQGSESLKPVVKAIEQYYSTASPANGYQAYVTKEEHDSRFYDDNQWIAIAYIDAYNRTRQPYYLDKAKEIYRFMMTGFDIEAGGGLILERR